MYSEIALFFRQTALNLNSFSEHFQWLLAVCKACSINFEIIERLPVLIEQSNEIIKNQSGLLSIMSKYKIGIFSFGITVCEAFHSGLPSIVLSHSHENDIYAKKIAMYDCMTYLGYFQKINFHSIPEETFSLMRNRKLYKKYSDNGQKMIDGKGSMRIAKRIKQLIK